jgi:hypothetical protein
MEQPPARITITRKSSQDLGQREIFVALDGEEIAILHSGEEATREVPPGTHRLTAHNTLFRKRLDLTLAPGEHARIVAINKAGWGTFSILAFLGAGPLYLTFRRDDGSAA